MPKEPAETHRTIDLEVRADLADAKDAPKRPEAAAYVFSQGGKLLTVADLDAEGAARVSLPVAGESTQVRVFVGPRLEKGARATLSELRRRGARERHVRLGRDQRLEPLEFRILPDTWHCWLLGLCVVRGTLVKRVTTDGYPVEFPVCDATVEIYEVDPFHIFISKLPKVELDRLRDYILHPRPLPEPPPEELPGPFPGPFPGPAPIPDRVPPSFRRAGLRATAEHSHRDAAFALADSAGASDLRLAARGGNRQVFEQALVAKADVVRPLLCVLFPKLVWMQKIGTATTDECGHFEELLFLGCHGGDKPDLYFKAKQKFLGIFDITIYAPKPVSCYTHWNYKCGTEVKLVTYHPLASTCAPCQGVNAEGNWVLFAAVGNVSLARIYGASDDLQASTTAANRGLVEGPPDVPFGGLLRPRLLFDSALRDSLGVKYYKLWWRKAGTLNWNEILGDIYRHYAYKVDGKPALDVYKLGPNTVAGADENNLYEIPPTNPPQGKWETPDPVGDTQNGLFDTTLAAPGISYDPDDGSEIGTDKAGKLEVMLELFDDDGHRVNIGPGPAGKDIQYYVPNVKDLAGDIDPIDAATLGLVSGNQMIVTVHVDNNPTYAEIDAPTIGLASADPCCGVLEFTPGDMVTIPWRAKHKNGFATYGFQVKRVAELVFSTGGPVGLVGNHSTVQSAATLLNTNLPLGCAPDGCDVAGFASWLDVNALATDGWSRLSGYDRGDFEAFVLSKK